MSAPIDLGGKSVVVTGASMGIGEVTARICLEAGARVTICARGADELERAAARLVSGGHDGRVSHVVADVSQRDDVVRLFEHACDLFGGIDAAIHAAAVLGPVATILDTEPSAWLRAVEIDLFGTFLVVREACARMRERGGRIALFSGGGASGPYPNHTAYACSKVAIVRLAESVAQEMRQHRIEINAVAPGLVATRMTHDADRRDAVEPDAGARAAAFLVSDAARGITGKLVSAVHDDYAHWPDRLEALQSSELFTLRRVLPRERGMDWQ